MFLREGFKSGFAEGIISRVTGSCRIWGYVVAALAQMVSFGREGRGWGVKDAAWARPGVCEHFCSSAGVC